MIRTQYYIAICLISASLLVATTAYASASVNEVKQRIGNGNPVAGKSKSELCQGCHGEFGLSAEDLIPNLAGQYASYIAKQLRNFQSGARKHEIMSAMAKTISDAELNDITAYFASQKKMQGNGKGGNAVAKNLFLHGDAKRDIPACASCHGVNGKGQAPNVATYPVIGGQHKAYLHAQLAHWRDGERSNSPNGMMNKVAKTLTDAEIEALAGYLSGL
ncbi:MAG: c-type cytochrome [Gallionellaceae bacterium]|nr:c-type cytochrome [Gallionellaceae bacterium]